MVDPKKQMLWVKVRASIVETKLRVEFGYFDIAPDIFIDVTEKLSAMDKKDLHKLVEIDDQYLFTDVIIDIKEFVEIQEDLGMKLAEAYNGKLLLRDD